MHKSNFITFILTVILILFLIFQVILPQSCLISNIYSFWTIFVILLIASFFSSAMEAALSVASKHPDILQEVKSLLLDELEKRNSKLEEIKTDKSSILSGSHNKSLNKLKDTSKKFELMEYSISEEGRGVTVGSFAALSVFLNVAITAFLPFALHGCSPIERVGIFYPKISSFDTSKPIYLIFGYLDLSGEKIFTFAIVAIPLLLLGKILPKEIGAVHYKFFSLKCNWFARQTIRVLGWLPSGTLWLISKLKIKT